MKKALLISVLLNLLLGAAVYYYYSGASAQEIRAEYAESLLAADRDALKVYQGYAQHELEKAAVYLTQEREKAQRLSRTLSSMRATASQLAQDAFSQVTSPTITTPPEPPVLSESMQSTPFLPLCPRDDSPVTFPCLAPFEPWTKDGKQVELGEYPVVITGGVPVVYAQAAVELQQARAEQVKLTIELDLLHGELERTNKALLSAETGLREWKKAAKKSRIKRFFSAVSKPLIFAAGVFVGMQVRR